MRGDDVEGRQEPLDRQQRGLGNVPGVPLDGEAFGVGRPVQDHLHVLADGEPVVLAEAGGEIGDTGVVRVSLALCVGGFPVPGGPDLRDPPLPCRFLSLMVSLGSCELALGRLM